MLILKKLEQASTKFSNKFSYDIGNATKVTDKVIITCPTHKEFTQEVRIHLRSKHGCPRCADMASSKLQQKTLISFIEEATKKHEGKYLYHNTIYLGDNKKVSIICPTHGEFFQVAGSHIGNNPAGCRKCGIESAKRKQALDKNILKQRVQRFTDVEVDIESYVNNTTPMKATCTFHGDFYILPPNLYKAKCACPICAKQLRGWSRSLYKNAPTTLYILKLSNAELYKIGITKSCDVFKRYGKEDVKLIESIVYQVTILDGVVAWDIEKAVLRNLKNSKYNGPDIFKDTSTTEIFTTNPTTILLKETYERLFHV